MKINIAGINIEIKGQIYDYFKYRLHNYIVKDDVDCNISILCEECDDITIPDGEIIQKNSFRYFASKEDLFYCYDILKDDKCSALIKADKSWTNITCLIYDVEDLGGASLNIRQFNMLGLVMKYIMIYHGGLMIHSSSLSYKESGVIFSADSGTGKSTHTRLWKKVFEGVEIINDDMPVIRLFDDVWYLCGSPWSGKTEININKKVPLKGIVFLERGKENEIDRMYAPESVLKLMKQTLIPPGKALTSAAMANISKLLETVPAYRLKCTISEEAPKVVASKLNLI
ncbi:MAG: hypothetical protein E7411_02485 [Ruminococcaceae bacterium]|nr:hypothetical protein [Oscillospiraceae bacterium]